MGLWLGDWGQCHIKIPLSIQFEITGFCYKQVNFLYEHKVVKWLKMLSMHILVANCSRHIHKPWVFKGIMTFISSFTFIIRMITLAFPDTKFHCSFHCDWHKNICALHFSSIPLFLNLSTGLKRKSVSYLQLSHKFSSHFWN